MNGYAGKILRVDLTRRKISTIPTKKYEQWVGGHGMGSAIFFDLVKDKTIDGFDPANVVTLMTSPLSGTLTPAAAGRTEVQGIGVQSYPKGWFTRSNFGGRFSTQIKSAGWDGIILEGKADVPVWLDVRNDTIEIRDCSQLSLWGMLTRDCQQAIWKMIAGDKSYGGWIEPNGEDGGQTTQRPAVLSIGPAGENLSRMACLIHDAGNGSGQGGFGAVWGSKNLKAISVIGTGSIPINNPKALMKARLWQKENYQFDSESPARRGGLNHQSSPVPNLGWKGGRPREGHRPQACAGCFSGCRARYESGTGNEASCFATELYFDASTGEIQRQATDLVNQYGLNAHEIMFTSMYLSDLNEDGVLGPGKAVDCPLDFDKYGSLAFFEQMVKAISYRSDGRGNKHSFGDALAEGCVRAAEKWGRLDGEEGDLKTGLLFFPHWGIPMHRDPRAQLEWGYGTILGDRDINEHDFDFLHWDPTGAKRRGTEPQVPVEVAVKIYTDKMVPFQDDPLMLDYSTENMYSEHIAKLVSWHRYYTRFWKQSALFCDWRWSDFINIYAPGQVGSTGVAEPKFLNAVTGKSFTFLDGIELGKKIWNLDHSIWTLQGRHRDQVHFADFVYKEPGYALDGPNHIMPGRKNGKWEYIDVIGRHLDREKFEGFKSRFYKLQGWETSTGYPLGSTLKSLGLDFVAEELQKNNKLGKG